MKHEVTTLFAVEENVNEQLSEFQTQGYEIAGSINIEYNNGSLHYMIPMKRISRSLLDTELSDLKMSARLRNAINNYNSRCQYDDILDLRDLVNYFKSSNGFKGFIFWRNFGKKTFEEVKEIVNPCLNIST